MQAQVLGYRTVDFTGNDGRPVTGTSLFVAFAERGVIGQAADKLFVNSTVTLPEGLNPGDIVDVSFNRKGKVDRVESADMIEV